MATIPFALSISHLVSSAGADVGFAAILGLAVMVLLFFSQARETATLRRRADEAEQQLRDLAAYVEQLSRRPAAQPTRAASTGTVAPVPPPAAARVAARQAAFPAASRPAPAPAAAAAVATIPAAPAGVGAPALSSATRLIPLAEPDAISIRALKNGNGEAGHGAEPESPDTVAAPAATATVAPVGPPPSTAAGGANGATRAITPPPSAPNHPEGPPPRAPERREGAAAGRPVGPPTFNDPVPASRTRVSRPALIIASAVAVIIVVVAVLVLVNRGGGGAAAQGTASSASSTNSAQASKHTRHHAAAAVTPSAVTVAVLNGTSTNNLAADVMAKLTSAGYKPGTKTNAPEQNVTSTIVGYTQPSYRPDALAVAKSLNLGPASVQGVSQGDRSAACPGAATGCPSQVVVTLGSDLSSAASTATTSATP
jgi:LytR cell envelope-related transcriptional attenuator